jgi:hypothetical protein
MAFDLSASIGGSARSPTSSHVNGQSDAAIHHTLLNLVSVYLRLDVALHSSLVSHLVGDMAFNDRPDIYLPLRPDYTAAMQLSVPTTNMAISERSDLDVIIGDLQVYIRETRSVLFCISIQKRFQDTSLFS